MHEWLIKIQRKGEGSFLNAATYSNIDYNIEQSFFKDFNMIVEEFPFYGQLTKKMQTDLIQHLFGDFKEQFNHVLGPLEEGFSNELIIQMYSRFYMPNNEICSYGQRFDAIYFLVQGEVNLYNA